MTLLHTTLLHMTLLHTTLLHTTLLHMTLLHTTLLHMTLFYLNYLLYKPLYINTLLSYMPLVSEPSGMIMVFWSVLQSHFSTKEKCDTGINKYREGGRNRIT